MHQIELSAAAALNKLREVVLPPSVDCDSPLVPGIYFSWDREGVTVDVALSRPAHTLMALAAKVSRTPRWFTLNIGLGEDSFAAGDVLGVVAELASDTPVTLPLFVRSAIGGEIEDTVLAESLRGNGDDAISTVLHTIDSADALAMAAGFHTLVIQLPDTGCDLEIRDLRLFVIPADRALRSEPPTLSAAST